MKMFQVKSFVLLTALAVAPVSGFAQSVTATGSTAG